MSNSMIQIIAEIGQAHDGSLGIAHSYIDALAEAGVDAVKFQIHIAEAESSAYEAFRVKFSYEDATRYDYWKRMEFTLEQWAGLKTHCDEVGLEFLASPFSNAAVDLLEKIGVKRYKVGSGEVNNLLLLEKIAITGKPVILSSGMSSSDELEKTMRFLQTFAVPVSLLQCTTAYPTVPVEWGLNVMKDLKSRYKVPVGFSDHSGEIFACLAASSLGAELIEFHVVFDKKMFGPDAQASLTIAKVKELVKGVRQIEQALSNPIDKTVNHQFTELKNIFEKSLAINRDCPAGTILNFDMLDAKKPKDKGIPADAYRNVIGKQLATDKKAWDFLNPNDLL